MVHDTSTNGSFIIDADGACVKVPKGQARPLRPGQKLRLSTAPTDNLANLLE